MGISLKIPFCVKIYGQSISKGRLLCIIQINLIFDNFENHRKHEIICLVLPKGVPKIKYF